MKPLVTIAIPTFNRPEFLRESVASALAQSYDRLEVLIGDNASSEAVQGWSRVVSDRDPRLRYQSYGRNLGMAGNWNALADAAGGEFFVLLADDDRLLPDFVSMLLAAVQRHDAQLAFSNHYVIDDKGKRLEEETCKLAQQYARAALSAGKVVNAEACVWQGSVPITASLMRTEDVRQLRFKEDLNTPEVELFVRLAYRGANFAFVPEYLSEYRIHSGSDTAAGLWLERLAEYLLVAPVSETAEPHKRTYMAPLLVSAVNRCLERGEREQAQRFLASRYYPAPAWRHPQRVVQSICTKLPAALGKPLLLCARSVRRLATLTR